MKGCLVAYFDKNTKLNAEVFSKVLGPSKIIEISHDKINIDFSNINFVVFILDSEEDYVLRFFMENNKEIKEIKKVVVLENENSLYKPIVELIGPIDEKVQLVTNKVDDICKAAHNIKQIKEELIIKSMPKEKLKFFIEEYLNSKNTCTLTTYGLNVRATPIEYTYKDGYIFFLSEGGEKFANLYINNKVSIAIYDEYQGMNKLFGMQIEGTASFVEYASDEYKKVIEFKGYKIEQIIKMPFRLNLIKVKIDKIECLMSKFKQLGYDAKQIYKFR